MMNRSREELAALDEIAACAEEYVTAAGLHADTERRCFGRLVEALVRRDELASPVYIGPRNPCLGTLQILRSNGRTACGLPVQPYWIVHEDLADRKVCQDCKAALAGTRNLFQG